VVAFLEVGRREEDGRVIVGDGDGAGGARNRGVHDTMWPNAARAERGPPRAFALGCTSPVVSPLRCDDRMYSLPSIGVPDCERLSEDAKFNADDWCGATVGRNESNDCDLCSLVFGYEQKPEPQVRLVIPRAEEMGKGPYLQIECECVERALQARDRSSIVVQTGRQICISV